MKHISAALLASVIGTTAYAQQDSTIKQAVDSTVSQSATEPAAHQQDHTITFSLSPSIGFTFQSVSKDGEESQNLQWLAQVQSRFSYEGTHYQFNSTLFAQYGAIVTSDAAPVKTQDNLQLSLVPSVTLSENLGLRLFFEVTGETQIGEGYVDSIHTSFLDPFFLYETLFLGHKTHVVSDDGSSEFEFVIGAGYAYQQTVTSNFVLAENRKFVVDQDNPLSHVQDQFTVEQGYSGILEMAFSKKINDDFSFRSSMRTVALTKAGFTDDIKNCRVGSLVLAGLQYKFLSIDYTMHVLYDRNLSPRRQLDQTMVFGFKFDI